MLAKASFRSFKALKAVDVELSPFTVFVGKNSSGKTSVLQGIHYVSQLGAGKAGMKSATERALAVFSGPRDPRRLATAPPHGPMQLSLMDSEGRALSVETTLAPADDDAARVLLSIDATGHPRVTLPGGEPGGAKSLLHSPLVRRFGSAVFLHLDASVMVRTSIPESEEPRLEQDGEGLASVLAYLAGAEPGAMEAITKDLSRIVPQVRGIRAFPSETTRRQNERVIIGDQAVNRSFEEKVMGHRFSLEMGPGRIVPADLLSEGTVLALGLLVALRQPRCPRLVLMDDIDRALHASAQAELVRCVRAILASRPDVQVLCTSHSPYLLDHVELDEVRVLALDQDGYVRCGKLSDHPESERWRHMLRTGEFWASVGEDWLLGTRADGG